jgi:hypothetical protein
MAEPGFDEVSTTFSEGLQPEAVADWTDASTLEPAPDDSGTRRRSRWLRQYQRALVAADFATAWLAVAVAYLLRFGMHTPESLTMTVAVLLPLGWIALIGINHGYGARLIGVGATEFQKIFRAFWHLTALIALTSYLTHADLARGFVLVALPLAFCLNMMVRYLARKWLHRQRARGRALKSVLLVGDADAISKFSMVLRRDQYAGLRVAGACVPSEVIADMYTIDTLGSATSTRSSARYGSAARTRWPWCPPARWGRRSCAGCPGSWRAARRTWWSRRA